MAVRPCTGYSNDSVELECKLQVHSAIIAKTIILLRVTTTSPEQEIRLHQNKHF